MSKDLKTLFGLREMAVNVPDKEVPGLKRAIAAAVNSKILPPEAKSWVPDQGATDDPLDINHPSNVDKSMGATGGRTEFPIPGAKPKAPAVGKKPSGYDPKLATRASKAEPKPADDDLDDDWFQGDDKPAKAAKPSDAPKTGRDGDAQDYPSFIGSDAFKSANQPNLKATSTDDDDLGGPAPFNANAYGSAPSSWDKVPDWMRDTDRKMPGIPGSGKDTMDIPNSGYADDEEEPPPVKKAKPSKAGKTWTDKDFEKKPGVLSRLFGRKK